MLFKLFAKKLSNVVYVLLRLHAYLQAPHASRAVPKTNFLIVTIAFNNVAILEKQYTYLKENLEDKFDYFIADNSSDKNKAEEIKSFCAANNISYIKIPCNPLTGVRASGSHGIALNWAYRNIIGKYKPTYFGFLDHDIFPLQKTSVLEKMRGGYYGIIRMRFAPYWYFWPGFSFFEYAQFKKYRFDFSPHHAGKNGLTFLDTGGANYNTISKKTERSVLAEATSTLIDLSTGKEWVKGTDTRRTFELINREWLHMRQISWREESSDKMDDYQEMLRVAREYK
jgi:hypothetical protein